MEKSDLPALITSIGSLVGVLILFIKTFFPAKKEKAETRVSEADAAETWEGISKRCAEALDIANTNYQKRYGELDEIISELRQRIVTLESRVFELEKENKRKDRLIETLKCGSKILVSQLRKLEATPEWEPDEL